MSDDDILAMAAICDTYVFGSPELEELHRRASHNVLIAGRSCWEWEPPPKPVLGRVYHDDFWYVVLHDGAGKIPTFRTLNHIIPGQHVPQIYDIPDNTTP